MNHEAFAAMRVGVADFKLTVHRADVAQLGCVSLRTVDARHAVNYIAYMELQYEQTSRAQRTDKDESKAAAPQAVAGKVEVPEGWEIVDPDAKVDRLRKATQALLDAAVKHVAMGEDSALASATSEADDALAACVGWVAAPSVPSVEQGAHKNFHRLLCERFGYMHDEQFWWRDELSLIEHIASQTGQARVEQGSIDTEEFRILLRAAENTPFQCRPDLIKHIDSYCALKVQAANGERDKFERMFLAACADLGLINEELGLDPDDGGAGPIIEAIKVLRSPAATEAGEQQ